MKNKVSVILASYNQGEFLRQSIQSVLQQTYEELELIIIDDCSLDNSWEIINSFHDDRILAYRNEKNTGCNGADRTYIYAIEQLASGKYVAIQHSCDFWEKDKLEKQVEFLENDKDKKYGAVFTLVNVVTETGDPYTDTEGFYYDIFEKGNLNRFQWLRYFFDHGNCLCHNSVLIRRECYKDYKLFVRGLRQMPDFYVWIRLCLKKEIYILQEYLTGFRMMNGQRGSSAYKVGTSIRASVEWFLILKQYRELKKYEDFVQVFPEIKAIMSEENFDSDFALAQMCLTPGKPNYYKLFGYKIIFDLENDKRKACALRENFNYEVRDFWKESGKTDIFGVFPPDMEKICSLFLDMGNGYTEQQSIKIKYMFGKEEQYTFSFYIPKADRNKLKGLRLDPIEEIFVSCEVVKACWGEKELELKAFSRHVLSEKGTIFLTTDPIYEIQLPEADIEGTIKIVLNMKRMKDVELEKYLLEEKRE